MRSSTLTSKGQVTIPVELRHSLDLHPGDTLLFEVIANSEKPYYKILYLLFY